MLIERLQWTRLRLLDLYGHAAPSELPAGGDGPAAVPRRAPAARRPRDTWTLELEPVAGEPLAVAPGQFTMLYAFGIGEVPISVSGAPSGPLVHTVRAVGAVTQAICAAQPGAVLGVRGPFGNAWPVEDGGGGDLVIVAGGIGLAPLRGARLRARCAAAASSARWCSSTAAARPATCSIADELERWRRASFRSTSPSTRPTATGAARSASSRSSSPSARFDPAAATALVFGPEIMMRFTAPGAARARASRRSGSTSRWSATCAAGSATAATASSARP